MLYCKKCVQPNTRPGLVFDADGLCAACKLHKERESVDWSRREAKLHEIASSAKYTATGSFDCVVGVSGGKDSHFQAFYARDRLDLKVLLVNCAPDAITEVGRDNLENLVQHGFDMISFRPNPKIMRAVTRRSFFENGNPVKPSEYPLYAVSYQAAQQFDIPLVIQGENPAETLGIVDNLDPQDSAWGIRHHNTLEGCNASDWVQEGIELRDLQFYQFPTRSATRAIYLGYYAKEWSFQGNTNFAVVRGLKGRKGHQLDLAGRISPYSSVDSDMQIVNQMLKYYKFGFGFVTDEVCYQIRDGLMTREAAVELVRLYDGKCGDHYIQEFCEYIDITRKEFWQIVDKFMNPALFTRGREPRFRCE